MSSNNHITDVVPSAGPTVRFPRAYCYVIQRQICYRQQVYVLTVMRIVWYHNPLCHQTYFALHSHIAKDLLSLKCMESYLSYIPSHNRRGQFAFLCRNERIQILHHDTFTLFTKSSYHLQFLNFETFCLPAEVHFGCFTVKTPEVMSWHVLTYSAKPDAICGFVSRYMYHIHIASLSVYYTCCPRVVCSGWDVNVAVLPDSYIVNTIF